MAVWYNYPAESGHHFSCQKAGLYMSNKCQFIAQCPIVKQLDAEAEKMVANRYCLGNFKKCHRYQLHQNNQPVADHTMPWDGLSEFSG
jgi:hypothetical protein